MTNADKNAAIAERVMGYLELAKALWWLFILLLVSCTLPTEPINEPEKHGISLCEVLPNGFTVDTIWTTYFGRPVMIVYEICY